MSLKQNATTIAAVIDISHTNKHVFGFWFDKYFDSYLRVWVWAVGLGVAGGCAVDDYDNHIHTVTSKPTQFCALICIR